MQYLLIQFVCFIVVLISTHDHPENNVLIPIASLIPGLGHLMALICVYDIVQRHYRSKGKCTWGHDYVDVTPKIDYPYARAGGYEDYQCSKCTSKISIKWSVF